MNVTRSPRPLGPLSLLAILSLLGPVSGCGSAPGDHDTPASENPPTSEPDRKTWPLGRMAEIAHIEVLPPSNRPEGVAAPQALPIVGPFEQHPPTDDGIIEFEAPIPARPRNLYFNKPREMKLRFAGGESFLEFSRLPEAPHTWGFTATTVKVRRPDDEGIPVDGEYELVWPVATERENHLNRATFEGDDASFVFRSATTGITTRTGVYLPAPSAISWPVHVPSGAVLKFEAAVLPPEVIGHARSDGAAVSVEVQVGDKVELVERVALEVDDWQMHTVSLDRWGGQQVTLRLKSDGAGAELLDYVFVAEPTLYVPSDHPRRLVIVFVDTLRADHLGMYGYARDTSPKLDRWAEGAVVFDSARSVASWTLPSARAAITGRQPERFADGPNLADQLGAAGYATSFWGGNVYLSANFDMADGWSRHECENWPSAREQIRKVEDWLEAHADQDAAVLVHLMDPHLPYKEPRAYRGMWAPKNPPAGLKDRAVRAPIEAAARRKPKVVKDWVVGRYDQNIRYVDDQLGDFLLGLADDAKVLIFADHGEEFWEHDGFEHGHALYDEVVRVPLIVKDPGVKPGHVSAPVSLLDVTPTLLDMVGATAHESIEGMSLLPAARGDAAATDALVSRPQAIGRTLYGEERWGVLVGAEKWMTHMGAEELFDLSSDPGETTDLRTDGTDNARFRTSLGRSLHTDVPVVWRIRPSDTRTAPDEPVTLTVAHPDGIAHAWLADDPLDETAMTLTVADDVVTVVLAGGVGQAREIFVQPRAEGVGGPGLELTVEGPDGLTEGQVKSAVARVGDGATLFKLDAAGRTFTVGHAVAPVPTGNATRATDDESTGMLKALGYIDEGGDDDPSGD